MLFEPETVALVTGASRGIGRAIALDLAREGAAVVVHYNQNEQQAAEVVAAVAEMGGKAMAVQANMAEEQEIVAMFRRVRSELGRLDVLVNNAGITEDGFLMMMSRAKWQRVLDVNLGGVFTCCREGMKIMAHQRRGAMVNLSSTSGIAGQEGQANYSAAKAGIIALTKTLAREAAPYGVRANVVAPGFIETDMTRRMRPDLKDKYVDLIPLKRMGKPEEVAYLVSFLASARAAYITGGVFVVDGGLIHG